MAILKKFHLGNKLFLDENSSHVVFDPLLVIQVPLGVWLLSDVSYSDKCRMKNYFQYAENMFPLFFAILKFAVQSICLTETNCVADINDLREEGKAENTLKGRYIVVLCLTEFGLFRIIPLGDCR